MSIIDKQLVGSDFCNSDCTERDSIIHPETCVGQVVIQDTTSLSSWFGNNALGTFQDYDSMLAWLQANWNINYTLPTATDTTLGGIKVDTTYLTINDGVLSLDADKLNIPSSIDTATYQSAGVIKLGNDTKIDLAFSNDIIADEDASFYPLRLDKFNRAGIVIPNFEQNQADWNNSNINSVRFIRNKPTLADVAISGSYNDLTDKPDITGGINHSLTIRQNGEDLGTFDNTSDMSIEVNNTTYSAATIDEEGLIKIGYTSTDTSKRPVQLDENNRAFVEISNSGSLIDIQNHEVLDNGVVFTDEKANQFSSYVVECKTSKKRLRIANLHDFNVPDSTYQNIQSVNNANYTWKFDSTGQNRMIAIIDTTTSDTDGSAKGCFNIQINTLEEYNACFVIEPYHRKLCWFSDCNWDVLCYEIDNQYNKRIFLKVPDNFKGLVTISNKLLITTNDSITFCSMDGTNKYSWTSTDGFDEGMSTTLSENSKEITSFTKDTDITLFVEDDRTLQRGDLFYDSTINDLLIHKLEVKYQLLEYRIIELEKRL